MRRIAILAEGAFEWHYGKTATGVIRYGKDTVVAVIDSTKAGMDVPQALGGAPFGHGIPVVRDIKEALTYSPDTLLIGIAPMGGALPAAWRWQLLTAIDAGLDLVSGLHFFLSDDEELRSGAAKRGVTIWDVRHPPDKKEGPQPAQEWRGLDKTDGWQDKYFTGNFLASRDRFFFPPVA